MNLKRLQYFVTLVEEGHFSRAAERLYITQPALTWNIKSLEEEMGTQLLKRHASGIELTEAGNTLYNGAKQLLRDAETLRRSVTCEGELQRRRIRFGLTILSSIEYMGIFQKFTQMYPNYRLDYVQRGSKEIQQMVVNKELDLALVSEPIYYSVLRDTHVVLEDYFYDVAVVVHKDNPLGQNEVLTLEDLVSEPISIVSDSFAVGNEVEKRFEDLNLTPNIVFVNENWEVLVEHVAIYKSVTFLPYAIRDVVRRDDILWIPLVDEKVARFAVSLVTSLDLQDYENQMFYKNFQHVLLSTQPLV